MGMLADHADYVIGVESVAIVPGNTLSDMEDIFGGIVIDLPAFQQDRFKREFVCVANQRLEPAARDVRKFHPVIGTWVFLRLDGHRHAQDPTLPWLIGAR